MRPGMRRAAKQASGGAIAWAIAVTSVVACDREAPAEQAPAVIEASTAGARVDQPTADAPTTHAPTADAPTADAPTDAPTADAATADAPTADAPTPDAPTADAPTADAPPADTPIAADGWQRGTVASGQSLSHIASKAGLGASAIAELVTALTPIMDPSTIGAGQSWALRLGDDGTLADFELSRSKTAVIAVARDDAGKLVATEREVATTVEIVELSATIDSSLWAAVTSAGGDAGMVTAVVDVFASDIDFYTDPRKGDRIALVVERHSLDGELVRHGRILAAEYRGAVGAIRGLWWQPSTGSGSWYTPEGKSLDRTLLKSPLKYARTSSGFNPKRMHPVLHKVKGHFGVDYAAAVGTPVWAAAGGEIVFRGEQGGAGNLVVLEHEGGFSTFYMHLSKFADKQKVGTVVAQKQVIGYVGTTGLSTGPHLHFGVKRGGKWVDPATVRSIERPGIPAKHRKAFAKDTAKRLEQLDTMLAAGDQAAPP